MVLTTWPLNSSNNSAQQKPLATRTDDHRERLLFTSKNSAPCPCRIQRIFPWHRRSTSTTRTTWSSRSPILSWPTNSLGRCQGAATVGTVNNSSSSSSGAVVTVAEQVIGWRRERENRHLLLPWSVFGVGTSTSRRGSVIECEFPYPLFIVVSV